MSTKTITWSDGSTSSVTYTGSGTETLSISHSANTDLDRTATLTVTAGELSATVSLKQYGECEYLANNILGRFKDSDGEVLTVPKTVIDADGQTTSPTYASLNYTAAQINTILAKIDAWQS